MLLNNRRSWYFDTAGGKVHEQYRFYPAFSNLHNWRNDPRDFYFLEFKSPIALSYIDPYKIIPGYIMSRILDVNDNCFVAIVNMHEGFITNLIEIIYNTFVFKHKIPPQKLYLFTGSLNIRNKVYAVASEFDELPINIEYMLDLGKSAKDTYNYLLKTNQMSNYPSTLSNLPKNKKYICFNRRWRSHRPLFVAFLSAMGLLDKGYVSLGKSDMGANDWKTAMTDIDERVKTHSYASSLINKHKQEILSLPDLYLDTDDLVTNRADIELSPALKYMYEDAFFSVVSETHCLTTRHNDENSCFLSEKFFKPIIFKHPFILVAAPHTLAYAKKLGFKTFHPYIDETYDTIENDIERLLSIANEVKRLCELNENELLDFFKFAREIVEYNYDHYMQMEEFCFKENQL